MKASNDSILIDESAQAKQALIEKLGNLSVPGFQVTFYPDEAEKLGAFKEDALSETDAMESTADLPAANGD